ncbi:MAG TPA: hypothetical protein VFR38_16035 [Gaiellaceae bacterium]|nr:hypothetical protein [Gaiellaceae bacterium]
MELRPKKPVEPLELGAAPLLSLATRAAAEHFGVDIDAVPSHKLRHRKRKESEESLADARAA